MVKSKSNALAKLPKEQRCQFLIGPVSSWFMPNTVDIWTQVPQTRRITYQDIEKTHLDRKPNMSTTINRLIDIKEDNSRVACVRFLKGYCYPVVMVLTESGSFLIHDCMSSENLIHYKKSELVTRFVEPYCSAEVSKGGDHCNKRAKFNVSQQINSCVWPTAQNAFLGVSLPKEKTNFLIWLKCKDIIEDLKRNPGSINKTDFIQFHSKFDLDLPQYASPICCMESTLLESNVCLVAVAMDDGLICIAKITLDEDHAQAKRVIKLARHNDQVCSMSFYTDNPKKFPMGLLASVSRDGLTLVWDIENEFYFADFQAADSNRGSKINWFALNFVVPRNSKHVSLAISNPDSGLAILEVPENVRSKTRLKDNRETKDTKQKSRQIGGEQTLKHHALLFNIVFDQQTNTLATTSLDGNHILWSCHVVPTSSNLKKDMKKDAEIVEVKPEYLFPCMANNSRTHMLRFSPIREDLLGAALGKAGVKFYKISNNPINHRFDMNQSCGLIARKINKASLSPTSMAWHPSHEYRLAIGTIEGKVIRVDLTPHRANIVEAEYKPVMMSRLHNNEAKPDTKTDLGDIFEVEYKPIERCGMPADNDTITQLKTDGIYSLCWGPNPTCLQDVSRLAIYAVGSVSKNLFIYYNRKENSDKMMNYLDEFLDQSLPEAIGESSEVAWKSSMDLMALGTTHGKVIIVSYLDESHADRSANKLFRKLAVIQGPLGNTHIQCLAWHPTTDKDDARYYHLAASANESAAYVFNIKESLLVADVKSRLKLETGIEGSESNKDETTGLISLYIHRLDAHKKAITDIAWNPHEPDQLATSSFDRCCYVWSIDRSLEVNFLDACIISKFSARDRLFTLEWSIVDTDLIFTSGHDSAIWAWRPSENPFKGNDASV